MGRSLRWVSWLVSIACLCTVAQAEDHSVHAGVPVPIVVFSAFTCPYCAEASKMLDQLQAKYPGKVNVIFKHFPLGTDRAAYLPHEAALAAGEQGRFWEMHDKLYAHQQSLDQKAVEQIAAELKLDMTAFRTALEQRRYLARIDSDVAEAQAFKVVATPTFYIDGFKLEGLQQAATFEQIIEHRLGKASAQGDGFQGFVGANKPSTMSFPGKARQ
jgi:protein-disulfide isomerase